jgi:cbb3-type cytochrome oxidase subunit 3
MTLLLLEALGAMVLLIFIVWWTMFSGRKKGELNHDAQRDPATDQPVKKITEFDNK